MLPIGFRLVNFESGTTMSMSFCVEMFLWFARLHFFTRFSKIFHINFRRVNFPSTGPQEFIGLREPVLWIFTFFTSINRFSKVIPLSFRQWFIHLAILLKRIGRDVLGCVCTEDLVGYLSVNKQLSVCKKV